MNQNGDIRSIAVLFPSYNVFGGSGVPSGKTGIYTNLSGMKFTQFRVFEDSEFREMAGRWTSWMGNQGDNLNAVDPASGRLKLNTGQMFQLGRPALLKNLRLAKFQAVFSVKGDLGAAFCFNGSDQDDFDYVVRTSAVTRVNGLRDTNVLGQTVTSANVPAIGSGDTLWVRVTADGSTVKVRQLKNNTSVPTSGDWSGVGDCLSCTGCRTSGGRLGFMMVPLSTSSAWGSVGNVTISSYDAATSAFDITEAQENFAVDSTSSHSTYGMASDTLTSDSNGNQTYDGTQVYTYDAWNRLKTVAHAYRDASNNLQSGQVSVTMAYDAKGRRISKAVIGTGAWDGTYHYYLNQNSVIEERNGSGQTVKQFVWGNQYIDELLQTSLNSSPTTQSICDVPYWACQDANFNVLGIVNSSGVVAERYEYTPYGQRTVYFSPGSNDPQCYSPTVASQKFVSGSTVEPWGLCEVGHQGLMHDEEDGLIYNRARCVSVSCGRFLSHDPLGYRNASNLYEYCNESPCMGQDPDGLTNFAQATAKIARGPWKYAGESPGPAVQATLGAGGMKYDIRNVRAWYVQPYVRLYLADGACCASIWMWGTTGYETGYRDSTGAKADGQVDTLETGGGNIMIPNPFGLGPPLLPIPGASWPTTLWGTSTPNWPGWNTPVGTPTPFGYSTSSNPPPPKMIGTPCSAPGLPIPPIPPPPPGFQ